MPLITFYTDDETYLRYRRDLQEKEQEIIKKEIRETFKRLVAKKKR